MDNNNLGQSIVRVFDLKRILKGQYDFFVLNRPWHQSRAVAVSGQ